MVEMRRNRGFRVRGLSADEIRAIFEFRTLLEVPAAERAAENVTTARAADLEAALVAMRVAAADDDVAAFDLADRSLHARILAALGNARVTAAVDALRDATQAMGASTMNRERRLAEIEQEHEPIVAAIVAGDAATAGRRMREHLAHTEELLARGSTA
jgi:DNA-binding GntR family transcriptional regulator